MTWVAGLPSIAVATVTVYEIASGIQRLPAGDKRAFLEEWFAELFILASAKAAALRIATRNVDHVRGFGVTCTTRSTTST